MDYSTSPRTHALCGDVSYRGFTGTADASTPGNPDSQVTTSSNPVAYDPDTRTFTISSTDLSLVGKKMKYKVQGFLKDYPYDPSDRPNVSETDSDVKEITYQDPCAALF